MQLKVRYKLKKINIWRNLWLSVWYKSLFPHRNGWVISTRLLCSSLLSHVTVKSLPLMKYLKHGTTLWLATQCSSTLIRQRLCTSKWVMAVSSHLVSLTWVTSTANTSQALCAWTPAPSTSLTILTVVSCSPVCPTSVYEGQRRQARTPVLAWK